METLVLGGYTRRENKGLSTVELNTQTNKLENVTQVAELESPTYVEAIGDFAFSIIKEDDWAGVALLEKTPTGYQLVSSAMTQGVNPPCYVSFDRSRQLVYSANYHQGFFEVTRLTDEGLEIVNSIQHEGLSVHENQKGPHVHYTQMDLADEYLLVCDLGTDEVYTYRVTEAGQVSEYSRYKAQAGFGPRHLVQHPTLPLVYILGELSNELSVCRYEKGELTHLQTVSLLPTDFSEWSAAAAIRLSRDGRFIYASNRGHDSIVVYEVSQETGLVTPIQWVETQGKTPRDFNFNKTEDYVIVGHQDDDVLSLFTRNQETGLLTLVDKTIAPECVCVAVVK